MVSDRNADHNNMYNKNRGNPSGRKKKTGLVGLFVLTSVGVVCLGILVFAVYGIVTGKGFVTKPGSDAQKTEQVSADAGQSASDSGDKQDTQTSGYPGREPIAEDDPVLAAHTAQEKEGTEDPEETDAADEAADEGNLLKNTYPGVYSRFGDDLDNPEYLAENRIYILPSRDSDEESVSMSFAGDILFDDEYAVTSRLLQNGGEISAGVDQALIDMMHATDITMLNNEFPYSYGGSPTPEKTYTFRADPPTVRYLDDMGVNVVGIANNHAFDFGEQAFMDTLATLEDDGMPYCGGGRNIKDASAPVYFVADDIKIGIIAATQIERLDNPDTRGATDTQAGVFRCLNPDRLLNAITDSKTKCDFLVVFIHWGTESTPDIDWLQEDQAPKIAAAGADLIIGAHPHVLQPIGTSKGIPVFYSLGNFWFNSKELDTCLVQAQVSAEGLTGLKFVPCRQVGCRTYPASGEEKDRIIAEMRAMSPGIEMDGDGNIHF